ncbi:MAG: valine--tRNA ligase [Candidatus Omnitrophica bacterium]|nr:valine--tRNA ligase [Candidatus Omnitrophota bacterium]
MISEKYNPKICEDYWYKVWEKENVFHVDVSPEKHEKSYVIVMPPPNVTGYLHIGHALNNTIQDVLIRWKRMQGFDALWVPGTDHAGIATQNVVERKLRKKGITRDAIGREKFIEEVWKWREGYGNTIINQLKKLGASCDWQKICFTLDERFSKAVTTAFVGLHKKGLIYRGKKIINWCPRCTTALSDEEVIYRDENSNLYYVRYPGKNFHITVATTRPETMPGDTAVAVNPGDPRYKDMAGKTVVLPFLNREIPIIQDEMVEKEFGSGAVKVTPGHDANDFIIGKKHNLQTLVIMDKTGMINENAGKFKGMDRFECRKKIIEELKQTGLIEKIEGYQNRVGHCYRCDTITEPYLSEQWFVSMKGLANPAIKAAETGKLNFYPERWKKVYLQWLENIHDWCISRQIWWGHRLPVYYCQDCKEIIVSEGKPDKCSSCNSINITQDTDVLDTWFSSWLWPFGVFGWPEKTEDLMIFYPTDTLVTAQEILFFWVARMVIAGYQFTGKCPFNSVYIHGTVRDETGKKMSKSLGNAIDPVEIIDQTGADALRFSLISLTSFGQDVFLPHDFYLKGRNFLNKVWNAYRYVTLKAGEKMENKIDFSMIKENELELPEKWILTLLNIRINEITKCLDEYRFSEAADTIYEFFWHQFCDWYLEISKIHNEDADKEYFSNKVIPVSLYVLHQSLKILHPFVPFITEELWHKLKEIVKTDSSLIIKSKWPLYNENLFYGETISVMEQLQQFVTEIRDIKTNFGLPITRQVKGKFNNLGLLEENSETKKILEFLTKAQFQKTAEKHPQSRKWDNGWFYIETEGIIDTGKEKEKIQKKLDRVLLNLEQVKNKLNNERFLSGAPEKVIEQTKKLKEELTKEKEKLIGNLTSIEIYANKR